MSGKEVRYRDASEREDDQLMMDIEEAMEQQQLQSQSSKRSRVSESSLSPLSDEQSSKILLNQRSLTSSRLRVSPSSLQTNDEDGWLRDALETKLASGLDSGKRSSIQTEVDYCFAFMTLCVHIEVGFGKKRQHRIRASSTYETFASRKESVKHIATIERYSHEFIDRKIYRWYAQSAETSFR